MDSIKSFPISKIFFLRPHLNLFFFLSNRVVHLKNSIEQYGRNLAENPIRVERTHEKLHEKDVSFISIL